MVCTFSVTVVDQQPPNIICPPNLLLYLPAGQGLVTNPALGTPTVTDNCAVASVTNNAPSVFLLGTNLVAWKATDASGNSNSCQQLVEARACSGLFNVAPLTNKTICPNTPVTFKVAANSGEPISYQWRLDGQWLPGETNDTLNLPYVITPGTYVYCVEVRTPCDKATNCVTLTVLPEPGGSPVRYTNNTPIVINEYGTADPYVTQIPPQCVPGVVRKLTVRLFGFYHNFPGDVSMMLISPDGRRVMLMSNAGGGVPSGPEDLTFSDAATNALPTEGGIPPGTYLPADYLGALPPGMTAPAGEPSIAANRARTSPSPFIACHAYRKLSAVAVRPTPAPPR